MARRSSSRSTKPPAAYSIRRPTKSIRRPTDPVAARSIRRPTDDVVVGVVRGPHGVKGEVRVEPLTDRFEERFRVGARLESEIGPVAVASVRGTAADPIVRFEGVEDRAAAERLCGELRVPRAVARSGEGYLWDDLIGMCVVTPDGTALGEVTDVLRAGGADVLVVRDGKREVLLPMLGSVIREVGADSIVAVPPEEA